MRKRFVAGVGAAAATLAMAVVPGVGPASASGKPPIPFSGALTCAASGAVLFSSPLVNGGGTPTTVTLKVKFSGCAGTGASAGGATLLQGSLVASAAAPTDNNCGAVLGGATLPALTGSVRWKASGGPALGSTANVTRALVFYNPTTNVVSVYLPTVLPSGSFAGETVRFTGISANFTGFQLSGQCSGGGLKAIKFGAPGGSATGAATVGA